MSELQLLVLAVVAIAGGLTVIVRDPRHQALVFSAYGLLMAVFFMVVEAPDVALSQVAVGGIVMPLMVLFALAKVGSDQ